MKTRVLSIMAAMAVLAGSPSLLAAERVEFRDLPPAVQNTVNAQAGASGIASIQRTTRHGIPLYEVRLSQPSNARPLYISETGSVINLDHVVASTAKEGSRKIPFSELPAPVQNTLRTQAGSARVEDIDAVTQKGETTYNAAFKRDGRTVELWLDANGNLLNQGNNPAASTAAQAATAGTQRVPLAAGVKADPESLPRRVQETLRKYAQDAKIEDVDRGTLQGRTVYEAAFKRNGQHIELRVAEDGTLIRDDVNDRFLASIGQAPASSDRVTAQGNQPSWALTTTRVPLAGATKATYRELPSAVRETLSRYSGETRIEDIDKGTLDGKTVYQAAFKHNDQNIELRIAEDGSLVRDAANERFLTQLKRSRPTAAAGQPPSWQILTGRETSTSGQLGDLRSIPFNQLPPVVQTALRNQAGQSAIDSVRQGTVDGKTVYEAFYSSDGQTRVVRVAQDGSLVR
ncbi:MAG: PepSY-like domain-containing protein [Verrucomicrobiia bacterium]